ncbi:MAG: YIP1 family protein [Aristaeellaceae bacterium]
MNRRIRGALAALVCLLLLASCIPAALADNATAYTYTVSATGDFKRTQDAYLSAGKLPLDVTLSTPEDLFIRGDDLYIADAGNRRIVRCSLSTGRTEILCDQQVNYPTGLYVDEQRNLYVADYGAKAVLLFSPEGTLLKTYSRPVETIFGRDATYLPRKIAVNRAGELYVVSEGTYDGIINLDDSGAFMGYFGFNYTEYTLWERIQNLVFTEAQMKKVLTRKPASFYNLDINADGIIYTVTQAVEGNAVKRHDISGLNMIAHYMLDESNFVDVCAGSYGQIYALTQTGIVNEYDASGRMLCSFGGMALSSARNGYSTVACAIARDEQDFLYILDRECAMVHVYYPTPYILGIHRAIEAYENGDYASSQHTWREIIAQGGGTNFSYEYLARTCYQTEDYENALAYARMGEARAIYSDAFWEVRNDWLMVYLPWCIGGLILLRLVWGLWRKRHPKPKGEALTQQIMARSRGVRDDLAICGRYLRHPVDTMFFLRNDYVGSVPAAVILYLLGFAAFVFNDSFKGFAFSTHSIQDTSVLYLMILYFGSLTFLVLANYLVATITEGEGRLRDVFVMTAYALLPMILLLTGVTLLSYVLTLNEIFFIQAGETVGWCWTVVLVVLTFAQAHRFSGRNTFVNVLLTLFLIAIALIVLSVLYMFLDQLYSFVYTVVKEVLYRVA